MGVFGFLEAAAAVADVLLPAWFREDRKGCGNSIITFVQVCGLFNQLSINSCALPSLGWRSFSK